MATILVVDDQESVLKILALILEKAGYRVVPASSGVQALMLYTTYADRVDLVLTDVTMPQMDGVELARRILAVDPHAKIAFMTGAVPEGLALPGGYDCVLKPFQPAELLETITKVIAR